MSTTESSSAGPRRRIAATGVLRYSRAYTLTIEALHTLSCGAGGMRERLRQIDPEFFSLEPEALPEAEGVRESFVRLKQLATRFEPRGSYEGRIVATIEQSHHSKLKAITQLIWDIHRDFSQYMQSDA